MFQMNKFILPVYDGSLSLVFKLIKIKGPERI